MTPKRWSILLVALASLIQGAMQFDVIPGTGLGHRLAEFAGWALLTAASVFLPKWFDRAPTLADTAASIGKVAVLLLVALPARAQPVPTDGASAETATCAFSQTDRFCLSARATLLAQASPQPGTPAAVTLPQSRDSKPDAAVPPPLPPGAANLTAPVVPPDLDKARAVAALATSTLHQLQAVLGIPQPVLPPAFYETPAGKVIVWTSFAFGVACSASGIVLGAVAAAKAGGAP